jgi:Flp pilus assembly protein TadG
MRKSDQRGVAALEFCLVIVPLFTLMFAIFDLGRYAITMHSLRMLANGGARAVILSYDGNTYAACTTSNLLPTLAAENIAVPPLLFNPQLVLGGTTVTASSDFTMLWPIWPAAFNSPSASTSIPFCGS